MKLNANALAWLSKARSDERLLDMIGFRSRLHLCLCLLVASSLAQSDDKANQFQGCQGCFVSSEQTTQENKQEATGKTPQFTKSFQNETIGIDQTTTLTFNIFNFSLDLATMLAFQDQLPDGLMFNGNTISDNCNGTISFPNLSLLTYSAGFVESFSGCAIVMEVVGVAPGLQNNITSELTSSLGVSPPATASIEVISPNDLALTKTNSVNFANQLDQLTYTITITNVGISAVENAQVADILPNTLDVDTATWSCAASPGSICAVSGSGDIVDVVDIPPNGQVIYTLVATVIGTEEDVIINMATVTPPAEFFDNDPSNNTSTDIDPIGSLVDGFESLGGE